MCILFIFGNYLYLLIIIHANLFILHFRDDNWDGYEHSSHENNEKKNLSAFLSFDFGLKYDLDMLF